MTSIKKHRHFLIVTHAFPPMGGGGVQRIVKFAKYLKIYNWHATVLCPTPETYTWVDEKRLEEIDGIEVIRLPIRSLGDGLIAKIQRKLRFVDPFKDWSEAAITALSKLDLSKFEIIFSSGPPHSVHCVGRNIKRKYDLKWVADFRDHFTLGPEYKPTSIIHSYVNKSFEESIYREADAIVTNTSLNQRDVLNVFSSSINDKNKIATIYNGYDEEDLKSSDEVIVGWDKEKLNLIYLGGLRGDHIDGIFYRTIKSAIDSKPILKNKIKIHVIGDVSRKGNLIQELGLEGTFSFQSFVAFNEVGAYLDAADAGLTWQRDRPAYKGTIAGKVFDYIGKALPIFSLGQENGEIANILEKHKIGRSASPSDFEESGNAFIKFCEELENGAFSYSKSIRKTLDLQFNRRRQAEQLHAIFNQLFDS